MRWIAVAGWLLIAMLATGNIGCAMACATAQADTPPCHRHPGVKVCSATMPDADFAQQIPMICGLGDAGACERPMPLLSVVFMMEVDLVLAAGVPIFPPLRI
jgi:hypothetical protein